MTDDSSLDDVDLLSDPGSREVVDLLRGAYVRTELPTAGPELAAVFRSGLLNPESEPSQGVVAGVDPRGPFRRRVLRRRGARLALGIAAVLVNLVGVGSAGLLPGPAQTVFEKATESVGVELPEPVRSRPGESPAVSGERGGEPRGGGGGSRSGPATTATVPGADERQPGAEQNRPLGSEGRRDGGPTTSTPSRPGDRSNTTVAAKDPRDPAAQPCVVPPGPPVQLPPTTQLPGPPVPTSLPLPDLRLPGPPGTLPPVVPDCPPPTTTTTTTTVPRG
jgi:hypothetical protein